VKFKHSNYKPFKAFSIIEVVVAAAILTLFAAGAIATMTQMNRFANVSRLREHASVIAQQKIDEILTVAWKATSDPSDRPAVLLEDKVTEPAIPINADPNNSQIALKSQYTDLGTRINATRTTEIRAINDWTVQATVTITFNYANRDHIITMNTIRTSDNI
jgi:type II secretory pathway pseudopilin PulG